MRNSSFLQTERCLIRSLSKSDFDILIEMYLEPDSNKYIRPLKNKGRSFYEVFLEKKVIQNQTEEGFWVVVDLNSNTIIGTVNLNFFKPLSFTHIGCHLKKETWGKGYATELLKALVLYAVEEKRLAEIYGILDPENSASKRIMQKIGFNFSNTTHFDGSKLDVYKKTLN